MHASASPTPFTAPQSPARQLLSLDGGWQIAESRSGEPMPTEFLHTVPVPGLVNLAQPPFPQVDEFESYELNALRILTGELPEAARVTAPGVSRQPRDYFWYRTNFRAPSRRAFARLTIGKAQFGTAAWLNGRAVGETAACFSASHFTLTDAVRWGEENVLVLRIGAHPAVLPATFPAGADFEKLRWTPGIYDRVFVFFADDPVIESVQVAPRLAPRSIVVQTKLKNHGGAPCTFSVSHRVREWHSGRVVATSPETPVQTLAPSAEATLTETVPLAGARLWSCDDPFLHVLETSVGSDRVETRFGLREFRSDAATGRFLLNDEPCYLRGSNIALHRFFEDAACGALPWNDTWVRRLLVDLPRQLHWNSFRFTIGPVPARWFEIADEAGLLIQNEFPVWTGHPKWRPNYARHWDTPEMIRQFSDWMRDHWNYASVVVWDACNETFAPIFGEKIIPAVRSLDLSARPWDNGYNPPVAADDPVEIHPYFYSSSHYENRVCFEPHELEKKTAAEILALGFPEPLAGRHPLIVNEYAWLWVNRDGTPTRLTENIFTLLLGSDAPPRERFALYAYILALETEFFRMQRYAGVQHFAFLTCSFPGAFTSDSFRNVRALELEPYFADYASEAFKPFGVCLKFYCATLQAGESRTFGVWLGNDERNARSGEIMVEFVPANGGASVSASARFAVEAFGQATVELALTLPRQTGPGLLRAIAQADTGGSTVSRRRVTLVE